MIVKLTTVRVIPDDMLTDWIKAVKLGLFWIDEEFLRKNRTQTYVSVEEIAPGIDTSAQTTVEVIDA